MTTIRELFGILMLVVLPSLAGADVRSPVADAGADVLHQQDTVILEEEEEDDDEEPDCE